MKIYANIWKLIHTLNIRIRITLLQKKKSVCNNRLIILNEFYFFIYWRNGCTVIRDSQCSNLNTAVMFSASDNPVYRTCLSIYGQILFALCSRLTTELLLITNSHTTITNGNYKTFDTKNTIYYTGVKWISLRFLKLPLMKIKPDSILSNIFGFKTNTTVLDAAIQKYTSLPMIVITVLAAG